MEKRNKLWVVFGTALALALVLTAFLYLGIAKNDAAAKEMRGGAKSILLIGTDEVAQNTDTLLLLWLNAATKEINALQIPRDTYAALGDWEGKINGIFAREAVVGEKRAAAERLTGALSDILGLSIDSYAVFDAEATAGLVDALGGVEVEVPFPMHYRDEAQGLSISIEEGRQHLTGNEAVGFLRFRQGYLDGDLGRLDAQMIFFSALAERLQTPPNLRECLTIYQKIAPKVLTNLSEKDIIFFVTEYLGAKNGMSLAFARLPGEGYVDKSGQAYFAVNRPASEKLLEARFAPLRTGGFDRGRALVREKDSVMLHIYEDANASYRVYTPDDIKKIHIKRR